VIEGDEDDELISESLADSESFIASPGARTRSLPAGLGAVGPRRV
jgi:hypothetical protein